MRILYIVLGFLALSFTQALGQTIIFSETFDGPAGGANWNVSQNQPTPNGIPNLTYTNPAPITGGGPVVVGQNGGVAINEACNNYWVINNAHTPDCTSTPLMLGQRDICNGSGPGYVYPNPFGGANNNSLHITYRGNCAIIGPNDLNVAFDAPDFGDEYSWYDDNHTGTESWLSASDQYAFMTSGFSTVGQSCLKLGFWYYIGGDQAAALTDRSVLFSVDGGATWQTLLADIPYTSLDHFTFGSCKPWQRLELDLPAAALGQADVRIAFRWRNDNPWPITSADYSYASGFNIDNITVFVDNVADWVADISGGGTFCANQPVLLTSVFTVAPPVIIGIDPITGQITSSLPDFDFQWSITPSTFSLAPGSSLTDSVIQVNFLATGNYNITLTLTEQGASCADTLIVKNNFITIGPCPPQVSVFSPNSSICATNPAPIAGSQTQLNPITSVTSFPPVTGYQWTVLPPANPANVSFVPSANVPNPTLTFSQTGNYQLQLAVTNNDNGTPRTGFDTISVAAINCECNQVGSGGGPPITNTLYSQDFNTSLGASGWVSTSLSVPFGNGTGFFGPGIWRVDDDESGITPPGCGTAGAGDFSLYMGIVTTWLFSGAVYDGSVQCNKRIESPNINAAAAGATFPLTLSFDFIGNGTGNIDKGYLVYSLNGGATWINATGAPTSAAPALPGGSNLNNLKSNICATMQGQWTHVTWEMPAGSESATQLKIGFVWQADAVSAGATDPSVAIDDVEITYVTGGTPVTPPGIYTCPITQPACQGSLLTVNYNGVALPASQNAQVWISNQPNMAGATAVSPAFVVPTGNSTGNQQAILPGGLPPGIYYVSVYPAGAFAFDTNAVQITILPLPNADVLAANATGPRTLCVGSPAATYALAAPATNGQVVWGTTNGVPFTVQPNGNSVVVNWPPTVGTDSVVLIHQTLCGFDTAYIAVQRINPAININIDGDSMVCAGSFGQYFISPQAGNTFTWTVVGSGTVNTAQNFNQLWPTAGLFDIRVYGMNICGVTDSIDYPILVQAGPTNTQIFADSILCVGASGAAVATFSGGGSLAWSVHPATGGLTFPGGTTGSPIVLHAVAAGTYAVVATASGACGTDDDTLLVSVAGAYVLPDTIVGPGALCDTTTAAHTYSMTPAAGVAYTWTAVGAASVVPNANSVTITWDVGAPNWEVYLSASQNGCLPVFDTVRVAKIDCDSTVLNLSGQGNLAICEGAPFQVAFNASGFQPGNTFTLEAAPDSSFATRVTLGSAPGTQSGVIAVASSSALMPGVYYLRVLASSPADTSAFILLTVLDTVQAAFMHSGPVCLGTPITFTDQTLGAASWRWQFGDNTTATAGPAVSHTYATAGSYSITLIVNAGTCPDTVVGQAVVFAPTVVDIAANPVALFVPDDASTVVSVVSPSGAVAQYTWFLPQTPDSIVSPNLTSLNWTAPFEGTYTFRLVVRDTNGCRAQDTAIVVATELVSLHVPNVISPNSDEINDHWDVQIRGIKNVEVAIFDRWGNLVSSQMFNGLENQSQVRAWDGTRNGTPVPEGVYVFKLTYTTIRDNTMERAGTLTVVR